MKRTLILCCGLSLILNGHAQERPENNASFDTVEAKQFIIRDSKGRIRARIHVNDKDIVSFSLGSAESENQLFACVHPDGTTIFDIYDRAHSVGISLVGGGPRDDTFIALNPQARVILRNYHFSPALTLGMSTNDVPYLQLMRPEGLARFTVSMWDERSPKLEFLGWQGRHGRPSQSSSNNAVEPTRATEGARGSP